MRHTYLLRSVLLTGACLVIGGLSAQVYDDIYYTPGSSQTTTTTTTQSQSGDSAQYSTDNDDYRVYSDDYSSEKYYDEEGNSYIVNNYYYDEYDESYMSSIQRFYSPYYGFSYYAPCYYPSYYYPYYYYPWYSGFSFSIGFNWGWGYSGWSYPHYGHHHGWGAYYGSGWGYPYYGYGWGYPYGGYGYYNGYYNGYYDGYYNGYYNGYYDGAYGYGYGNGYYYGPNRNGSANTGGGDRTYNGLTGGGLSDRLAANKGDNQGNTITVDRNHNVSKKDALDVSKPNIDVKKDVTVKSDAVAMSNNNSVKIVKSYTNDKSHQNAGTLNNGVNKGSISNKAGTINSGNKSISTDKQSKPQYQYAPSDGNSSQKRIDNSKKFDTPKNNNNTYQKQEFSYPDRSNERIDNKYSTPPNKTYRNETVPEKSNNNWFNNRNNQSDYNSG